VNLVAQRADRNAEHIGGVGSIPTPPSQCLANQAAFDRRNGVADKLANEINFVRWEAS
jgi:hypothetical protein